MPFEMMFFGSELSYPEPVRDCALCQRRGETLRTLAAITRSSHLITEISHP
jgi:hypothetical protein